MSEPVTPKGMSLRPAGVGMMSDPSAPAQPRQVARLRFLGVSFREPLTISQAGALIDRTNADPAYASKIEEWHVRKFELYPALYPPAGAAVVVPSRQDAGREFHLPSRTEHEPNATIFQKRRLELFSGCDFPVMDSLGREQAGALITYLESQAVARSLEAVRADAEARLREAAAAIAAAPPLPVQTRHPQQSGGVGKWLMLIVAALAVGGYLKFAVVKAWVTGFMAAPTAEQVAGTFQQAVALSQGRAVKKYPALGVAGSQFNAAFVTRYTQLSQQHSPLLDSPDWPEKLADECAAKIPAQAR